MGTMSICLWKHDFQDIHIVKVSCVKQSVYINQKRKFFKQHLQFKYTLLGLEQFIKGVLHP